MGREHEEVYENCVDHMGSHGVGGRNVYAGKVLGEWEEKSSKVRVEVVPGEVRWRGMGHGKARYEWVQYAEEPYRVRSKIRGQEWDVDLRFSGEDVAIAEPDIWDHLSDEAKEMLRDVNRQHGCPEREFRLIFKRVEKHERK